MGGIKLIQQFEALSDTDLIHFRKFLAVNGNRQLNVLFEYLVAHREEAESMFAKPMLFKKMFPKERDYNDVRLRNVMTRLGKQIEAYLIQDELQEAEELKTQLLVRAYEKRNAYALFKQEFTSRLRTLDAQKERGISFFRERARLYQQQFFHKNNTASKTKKELFTQMVSSFETWFELGTLAYQSDYLVQEMVLNEENPSRFTKMVLDQAAPVNENIDNSAVNLLFHICSLPSSGLTFETMNQVCEFYHAASPQMEVLERNIAAKVLISKVHTLVAALGDERSFSLLFNLYKDGLEMGMYTEGGRMHVRVFTGIVVAGATVGDFAWTSDFIKNHGLLVEEKERENAILLGQAYLNYNQGRKASGKDAGKYFDAAMLALREIQHGLPEFELRVRSLQLRIFYDHDLVLKKNEQLLNDFSRNFRQYLRHLDDHLSNLRVQAYLDFIHYTLKLARLHSPNAKNPLEALDKTIYAIKHKSAQVMMRHWLMEKAEELNAKLLR